MYEQLAVLLLALIILLLIDIRQRLSVDGFDSGARLRFQDTTDYGFPETIEEAVEKGQARFSKRIGG